MKRIISILITVSVLLNAVPALAEINDNDETEISAEAPWDISDEAAEAEPTQIPQTETYYTVDETESEAEKYEPMVHTEIITDDIELPEEEYNLMGTVLPNPFDVSLFSETNTTASVWNEMFSTQFGDDYLKPYEKKADGQRVSGNTNRLTIEETDLSLPGKNGLDFVLKRRHDNQDYNKVYSLSGNNEDANEQMRYMAAFKNTSTNERIYIAFYTEDDFYTYMYNGNRLIGLKNLAQYSYKKDGVTYSFYKFEDIYNKITDSTSYDFYAYDSAVEHGPFTYFEDGGSQYDIASWNLLLENNSLGDNWNLVMPDVFLYKYSNEITHNKENSIYRGEYSGAFRDLDGNIYNLEGNDIYTKNSASTGKEDTYTSTFSCKNNRYLKIEKLLKEQTLNNGLRYNFTVKDNRGYTYYFYDPAAVESLKRARKQIPRIVAVEDIYGNRITYEYDSNFSYISTITDTYGREINIEHNSEKTIVSYYDDTEGETKTITYETSTLPASELDNDSPIKQKNVQRFTVTNQLGEKTMYDAREAKVINAHRELSVDINEYPKVYYDTELHSTNSNIERIIYPTGAETRYKYKCQYYQSDESKLMRGAYAVVASYDISDGKEVNKREYSFTNSGREVTSTEINEAQKSKTVRQYNDDGLLREQRITATDVKGSPYISTAYVYDTANKPKTITVNNNGVKNISSYQYVDGYPDLLTMETSGHKKIRYTYHMNDSRYTDKVKTAQHYNGNYIVSTELTSDGKSVEYERVTQNDVIKSQVKYSYDSEGNVTSARQWTSDSNGDGVLSDSDEYTEVNSAYTNTAQKTRDITNTVTGIENADGADEGSVTDMFKLNIYGYPTYKKDSYGTVTTVEYDALNRPVKYNMPNGGTRTIEYNTQDKYTIVTDEAGIQYKYIYDDLGRIKEKYRIYGNHSSRQEMYTYDSGGRLSSKTAGKNGAGMTREVYAYDGLNRMTSRTVHEYSGRQLYIETYAYACVYDSTQGKYHEVVTKSTTASDGTETADVKTYNNEYGETERIETISGDMVLTAENTYDNQGHLIKTVDANGNAATYEYTYDGQVSKVTNADSGTVTTQYDLTGRAVSVTDANGNTAVTDYDKLGRAVKVTAPFDGTRNAVTKTYYDKNSNVVKKAVRENDTTYQTEEYRYDNMGNLTAASAGDEGEKSVTQYEYDSANRMTKMITGLAEISATPAGGNVTTYEYGADGFMLYRTDPMGNKEQGYEYDSYGNIMQRSDRNGNVFDYTYGAYGVKQERSIVGETKTNIYNSLGQITGTIDDYRNEKVEESYTYDAFGRMSSMTSADGTVQNYTYDSNSNVTAYSMTKDGTVRDRVSYEYDNMNRLTKLENDDIMFVYAYDLNGNLRNVMDGKSTRVDTLIAYNKANLPTIYRIRYNGTKNDYAMSYYLTGQKYREEDRTNNTLKEYYYNSKGQLNIEQAQRDNNYTIGAEYSYDAGGNRIQKKEHYLETYSTDVTNYTYDANNRLTQTAVIRGIAIGGDDTAGEVAELTRYYYDDNGNTIAEQNKTYTSDGEQSSGMQLSGRASGNSFKLYTYDDFNRLRQYNDGSTEAKYAYNASNLRTSKTVNRKKTDFVWNGQNLASETTNDVTTVYDYDLTGIIASTVNGEVTKYVKDPHGNVVVTSRNGSIAGEYDYSAFGEQLTATDTTNPFRYCGEYYDNENGLTYLRNRYYDSNTGRFLSEDPIKDGMNWYSYCGGDPVMMVDPSGCSNIPKWLDWDEDGRIDTKADRARFDSDNNGVADWREEFDDEGPYGVNNNKSAPAWYQCRNSKVLYDFPWRYQAEGVLLCWAYAASEVIEYMTGKNIVPEQIAKDRLTYENSLNDGTVITDYNMGYTTKAASELIKHCGYLNGSGYEVEYMKSFDFNYIKNQIDNNIPAVLSFSVDGGRHDVAVMGYAYDNEIGKEFILYYDSTDNPIPREIAIKSNMRLYSFNKIR